MARPRGLAVAMTACVVLGAAVTHVAVRPPAGPRSLNAFDPDRMAELEVGMWQAYYRKQRLRLFSLLGTMLHEQYR